LTSRGDFAIVDLLFDRGGLMRDFARTMALMLGLLLAVGSGLGCGPKKTPVEDDGGGRIVQSLLIEFDQRLVFPTSVLTFRMKGSDRMVPRAAEVVFEGTTDDGREINWTTVVQPPPEGFPRMRGDQGDVLVKLPVSEGFWDIIAPGFEADYQGAIGINLVDEIGPLAEGRLEGMTLTLQEDATPTVQIVASGDYYPNETIEVSGDQFLRPAEGNTWAVVSGTFTYANTELGERAINGERVPIRWTGSRTKGDFHLDPNVFGVQPGQFSGSLSFENELSDGQLFTGGEQESFEAALQQTFLASLDPPAGSRGQRITLTGRGFVNQADDGSYGMFLELDGTFTYDEGGELDLTGGQALVRPPDRVLDDERAEMAVWYEIDDGRLTGLGAEPGTFEGTITPVLFDRYAPDEFRGIEYQGTFRVNPTKQMVHLKYLPGFSKGLEKYGLQNVEFEIRQRILEVTNRDYADVNVEFVESPPEDFLEYATIEIGGPDPTGGGKFGYDNTCNVQAEKCKDTSNLYLGDYLGGVNANSADEFNTPFGGVFIESFDYFSPTLNPEGADDGSPEFDRIMEPFMRDLGGTPVRGTEYPGGERDAQIEEAVKMVGSVIGNTCTHEIGHSLGLAFFPQDLIRPGNAFHNKIPCDDCIMDSGSERPFVERGEISGAGPAEFNERNLGYLKDILPLPQ
jgi:hypothetical protein